MTTNSFFTGFLKISTYQTFIAIIAILVSIGIMIVLKNKKVSFSARMIIGLLIGVSIGVGIDLLFKGSDIYKSVSRGEITLWYSLLGSTFVKLIQLMAVPVVFFSIFFVILDFKGKNLKSFTFKTLTLLLGTTAIAALIGVLVTNLFNLTNSNLAGQIADKKVDQIANISGKSFPQIFAELIPNNIFQTFTSNSAIISVVVISVLFAKSAKLLRDKKPEKIAPVISVFEGLKTLINSVLVNIIKMMPYAVIALVSNTLISNGIDALLSVLNFIFALHVAVIIMLMVYIPLLLMVGVNPVIFYKKALPTLVFAFSSRSSVGTLPYTLDTLENKMGVSNKTANFIGSLSTTVGMNGCAGVFPAMLGVIVAGAAGVELSLQFYLLVVIVVTLGSVGIAGVPGTATVAATVTLNGLGLGKYFDSIGAIFGIDPLIDMARTMLNVCGAMVSAVVVDNWENTFDKEKFNSEIVEYEQ